jgi:hypothetical protein
VIGLVIEDCREFCGQALDITQNHPCARASNLVEAFILLSCRAASRHVRRGGGSSRYIPSARLVVAKIGLATTYIHEGE